MTPFGVGNDYGGSVRLPAHANGVCGLKPTPGRIPGWKPGPGVVPFTVRAFTVQAFAVEGPLARTVGDLDLAYSVMCGFGHVRPGRHRHADRSRARPAA
jgi:amidase